MRVMMGCRAIVAGCMLLAACNVLTGASDLRTKDSAPGPQAAPPGRVAGPDQTASSDASTDGVGMDGGVDTTMPDAAPEAGALCTPGPGVFCDDFDQGALGGRWTSRSEMRGALSLVNDAVSPPNASTRP